VREGGEKRTREGRTQSGGEMEGGGENGRRREETEGGVENGRRSGKRKGPEGAEGGGEKTVVGVCVRVVCWSFP
jgi:hypothetical protein